MSAFCKPEGPAQVNTNGKKAASDYARDFGSPQKPASATRTARDAFDFLAHQTLDQGWQIIIQPLLQHWSEHRFRNLVEGTPGSLLDSMGKVFE